MIGPLATADVSNAKYVLFLGRNYAEGLSPSNTAALTTAYEKGIKVVIVDPRHNAACILANEWVPIRPGTDLGLLLGIANVLIGLGGVYGNFLGGWSRDLSGSFSHVYWVVALLLFGQCAMVLLLSKRE